MKTDAPTPAPILKVGHLLAIEHLSPEEITALLDLGDEYAVLGRAKRKRAPILKGRTIINMFFENSTRTQSSFELAGKRLGADVMNMSVKTSSVAKGETLIDTAVTLNSMQPDILVVRHQDSGAAELLSRKLDCCVVNAGDGLHAHPTQGLLDGLTMRRHFGHLNGLTVAICGDVSHSRVARSDYFMLTKMGAKVRFVGPATLLPNKKAYPEAAFHTNMCEGIRDADVVIMLRLQLERMSGAFVPSAREYFRYWGLDREKLAHAKPHALVMHPGPMNRGIEIDSEVADDPDVSLIHEQVEMGVAIRMAVMDALSRGLAPQEALV